MLKSVLATMPTYPMSCFKLPNSLYRIQSALTRFLCGIQVWTKRKCARLRGKKLHKLKELANWASGTYNVLMMCCLQRSPGEYTQTQLVSLLEHTWENTAIPLRFLKALFQPLALMDGATSA